MKTRTLFGLEQVEPCRVCGTPQVGCDYDENYYIIPGTVQERPVCHRVDNGMWMYWSTNLPEQRAASIASRSAARAAAELAAAGPCPQCGGNQYVHCMEKPYWGNAWYVIRCLNGPFSVDQHIGRKYIDRLPGCEKCCKKHSI